MFDHIYRMHSKDAALIHIRIDVRIDRRIEEKNKLNICKLIVAYEISIRRNLINRVTVTVKHAELGPATW